MMRRKKMILCGFLLALIFCSGCADKQEEGVNSGNIKEAESGMTDEEIIAAIEGKELADLTLEEILSYTKLPVVYLTMEETILNHYREGVLKVEGADGKSVLYDGMVQIKLRGDSTRFREKQPYKMKLETKTDLYGMGESKHWVLLANDIDHTLIRNKVTFDFADAIGMDYSAESVLVTLVYNGEYQGVYQLCEHIRVDEERVDIYDWDEYFAADEWSEELGMDLADYEEAASMPQTGGFILEADFYALEDYTLSRLTTNFKQPFYFNTPEDVPKDSDLFRYAANYIQSFEYALHSDNFVYHADDIHYSGSSSGFNWRNGGWETKYKVVEYTDTTFDGYHYTELFDMDSLVQNFLVCELAMNWDSMKNSVFLYKDIDGLAKMGPVWDFDWAYGNVNMYNINTWYPTAWHTTNNDFTREQYYQSVQWNRYLIKDPYFLMKVYEKYLEIREGALAEFQTSLEEYERNLLVDGLLNDLRWGYSYSGEYYNRGKSEYFEDASNSLQEFVSKRLTWLDKQFADFDRLLYSLGYYKPSEKLSVSGVTFVDVDMDVQWKLTVSVSDADICAVEYQINGVNFVAAEVADGICEVMVPTGWFTDGLDMIQIRAIGADGEYLYMSDEPEAATISNYYLFNH